jgi:hypothetical protein
MNITYPRTRAGPEFTTGTATETTLLDIMGVLLLFCAAVLGNKVVIGTETGGFGSDAGPFPVFSFNVTNEGALYVIDILSSSVLCSFCFSRT